MLVIKRDKKVEPFDVNKIDAAITKAFNAVNVERFYFFVSLNY